MTQNYTFKTYKFTFKLKSILEVYFLNSCISFQTQKYTSSGFSIFMYLSSSSEVYLKYTFQTYVFMCKLRSMPEVYTFSKLTYFFSNSELYLK